MALGSAVKGFAGSAPLPPHDRGTLVTRAVLCFLPHTASLGGWPQVSQPRPMVDLLWSCSRDREVSAGPEPAVLGLNGWRKT